MRNYQFFLPFFRGKHYWFNWAQGFSLGLLYQFGYWQHGKAYWFNYMMSQDIGVIKSKGLVEVQNIAAETIVDVSKPKFSDALLNKHSMLTGRQKDALQRLTTIMRQPNVDLAHFKAILANKELNSIVA